MRIVTDLHIHSKYSRATSRDISIDNLHEGAKKKGINLLGTGDFTHPGWVAEIEKSLVEDGSGFLIHKTKDKSVRFILSSEISAIYSKNGRVRKIHIVVLASSIKDVKKINRSLARIGNITSDGRPILGIDAEKLAKIIWDQSPEAIIIPAHIWTPWFSLFGSNSGFDTIEECFGKYSDRIYAFETGLSSDPEMNWTVSQLDNLVVLSNSDAHSVKNLMREATVFEFKPSEFTYENFHKALKEKDLSKIKYTIEFFPEEGKYHFDGHRACNVSMSPYDARKLNNICPECGKQMTLGVYHRITDLADRKPGEKPEKTAGVKYIVPIAEILSQIHGVGPQSKKIQEETNSIVGYFGSELGVLLDAPLEQIEKRAGIELKTAIDKMRIGEVEKIPGFDGVFGQIKVPFKPKAEIIATSDLDQQKLF